MTRTEHEADQIVFRWDSENPTGNTGFGPVAWSGPREDAENVFRLYGPVLRATGDETRPALIRLRERASVVLIRRAPFKDADGRTSVLCHALVGAPGLLDPAVCLGLHAWTWEGAAAVDLTEVRGGRLPAVRKEVLVPAAGRGQRELDARLPYVAEELVGTVAEFLRHPGERLTVLDERGDTTHPVLWGLHSMLHSTFKGPWTFATHDTLELASLRFAFVGRWSGAASRNTERHRVDPRERCGDRAEEIAARLVHHHLEDVSDGTRDQLIARVLHATASTHRTSLLDAASRTADRLDALTPHASKPPTSRSRDRSGPDPRDQAAPDPRGQVGPDPRDRSGPGGRGAPDPRRPGSPGAGRSDPRGSQHPAAPGPSWFSTPGPAPAPAPDPDPVVRSGGAGPVERTVPPDTRDEPVRDPVPEPVRTPEPPPAPVAPPVPTTRPEPVPPPPYAPPVLPAVEPQWTGPGKGAGRPRRREAETSLVHKLRDVRSVEEARELVGVGGDRELLDALRRQQAYAVVTVLLGEVARRLPSWGHGLRRELCTVVIGRELWAVGPSAARGGSEEPSEDLRAVNAAELHRWAVRPLLGGGDVPVGAVATLLSRLHASPEPSAWKTFWLIVDGERPGLPDAVWLHLLKEAYGLPHTAPRPAPPAPPPSGLDHLGSGYTRRFLRRAALLIGGMLATIVLIDVARWLI
ncbi:hypothetical protein [Streptomyces sp. NPDC004284]|uniref:hypothetical protein n=1 Tax=Streptomyces sp. NPDC004284 TaxID=3364695 RepID=UPI00368C8E79